MLFFRGLHLQFLKQATASQPSIFSRPENMASTKVEKPVGTQVPPAGQAKKEPGKAEGGQKADGGLKAPAQKPAPKKTEQKAAPKKSQQKATPKKEKGKSTKPAGTN